MLDRVVNRERGYLARARRGRRRRTMPCSGKSLSPRPLLLALSSFINRQHQNHDQTILTITSPPTTGHALRPASQQQAIADRLPANHAHQHPPAGVLHPFLAGNPLPSQLPQPFVCVGRTATRRNPRLSLSPRRGAQSVLIVKLIGGRQSWRAHWSQRRFLIYTSLSSFELSAAAARPGFGGMDWGGRCRV